MSEWDAADFSITANRVLLLFDGWLNAIDEVGLEHAADPRGHREHGRFAANRQMVTGGESGGKRFSEAPHYDRSMPYV